MTQAGLSAGWPGVCASGATMSRVRTAAADSANTSTAPVTSSCWHTVTYLLRLSCMRGNPTGRTIGTIHKSHTAPGGSRNPNGRTTAL